MSDTLVRVEGVSKKFCRDLKKSLWYGLQDIAGELVGSSKERRLRPGEFWAVDDVSFELKKGDCLGLIGPNGAGKSTLLKMLNGLIKPDRGRIELKGRVGALIELGAGFNPILTGRENIYVNGAVLGLNKSEVDALFDQIVAYSELQDFIDTPVQYYSSGMRVRLGFSIASQLMPDILLIDEVLAVGDLGFKLKCFGTMDQMLDSTAIIFVSHSMPMISRMCTDIMLFESGKAAFHGRDVGRGIDLYYNSFPQGDSVIFASGDGIRHVRTSVQADEYMKGMPVVQWMDDLTIDSVIEVAREHRTMNVGYVVHDKEQKPIASFNSGLIDLEGLLHGEGGALTIQASMTEIQLAKGVYSVDIVISEDVGYKPLFRAKGVCSFQISDTIDIWAPVRFNARWKINDKDL